jgi:hypothetical protein
MRTLASHYVVHLQARPHVDGDRAIKALLKTALRRFGLRCLTIKTSAGTTTKGMTMESFETVLNYIDQTIALFERDPADTDFQRGFLEALLMIRREALREPSPIEAELMKPELWQRALVRRQ